MACNLHDTPIFVIHVVNENLGSPVVALQAESNIEGGSAWIDKARVFGQTVATRAIRYLNGTVGSAFFLEFQAGETDRLRWVTGLYYLSYDSDIVLDVGFFAPSAFFSDQVVETDNWSVFGQVEWDFTADWTLIAGLRYLNEEKEIDASGSLAGFIAGLPIPRLASTFNTGNSPLAHLEEDDVAGKIQLNWQSSDNLLFYAGVSRGVKAGGFNATFGAPGITSSTTPYSKETPITYEVGFKSTLMNGRALVCKEHWR